MKALWFLGILVAFALPALASPPAPDGTLPQVDYPAEQWFRNIGSRIDGSGMCVFTSFEFACRWHGIDEFRGFRDWAARKFPGGGHPEKLAKLVRAYCQEKGIPEPDWWQYEGSSMEFARKELARGGLICSTLYRSPRYSGTIYHMVCLNHLGPKGWGCVMDNNGSPDNHHDWGKIEDVERWCKMNNRVWLVGLRAPGPPPPPWRK